MSTVVTPSFVYCWIWSFSPIKVYLWTFLSNSFWFWTFKDYLPSILVISRAILTSEFYSMNIDVDLFLLSSKFIAEESKVSSCFYEAIFLFLDIINKSKSCSSYSTISHTFVLSTFLKFVSSFPNFMICWQSSKSSS